ncbi:type II TA system antitoxin MqsA family protein [Paraburkholderia sp. BL25I1N1]|uniref:type II TA system antitoxin MqsA family protein n=1 Tax=Paraburkholderia sp. BL25I1N1 TaxID=1938804 RepID=UPI000D057900|nr:type II TA system antitoxin MqsA family protein [Paraburkholderia sp. BL25I1N1]PRY07036.1 putative zinc finger/helix-turn-helix YgiT family protein [Paraburkholderia sp. BL25I1N1]
MDKFGQCVFCEGFAGSVREESRELKTKYGVGTYQAVVSVCAACGEEFVTPEQAEATDRRVADLRRKLKAGERTLSGGMIKEIREHLGWSQRDASEILGGGEVAFSRYESESVSMSRSGELLLKTMYVWPDTIDRVRLVQSASLVELKRLRDDVAITNRISEAAVEKIPEITARNKVPGTLFKLSYPIHNPDMVWATGVIESALTAIGTDQVSIFPELKINHGRFNGYRRNPAKYRPVTQHSNRLGYLIQRSR